MNTLDLSVKLFERHEGMVEEVKHYHGIMAIYGLLKTAELKKDQKVMDKVIGILNKFPDEINHPNYFFPSYRICGVARAYALYRGIMTDDKTIGLVRDFAEEMMRAPRDYRGIVRAPDFYKINNNFASEARDLVWIDELIAITPFLLFAGLYFKEDRYIDEAVKQAIMMYDLLLDRENGLLHQCQGFIGTGIISEDHWSRGNAWGYFAMTELVMHLPSSHPQRRKVEEYFAAHSWALLKHATPHGLWNQEITIDCFEEISGSALILYGFGIGLEKKVIAPMAFAQCYEDGIKNILELYIDENLSVKNCGQGCLCCGFGKEKGTPVGYAKMPPQVDEHHVYGPLTLMMSEAYKNGITESDNVSLPYMPTL